jgi:hypothetical protein
MAGFSGLRDILTANSDGSSEYSVFRKTPSQVTTAGIWFDLAMMPSVPAPLFYASSPLVSAQLKKSTDGGLNHGVSQPDYQKHLQRFLMMSNSATGLPMPFILCDYLMYYPFVDQSTNDEQLMDNTQTLPRWTDGKGVQIMVVGTNASGGALPTFTVNYTNSSGVAGRVSAPMRMNAATATGSIITSVAGNQISSCPFVALQGGDSGVRSIESVTMTVGTDIGLFCFVLVKPLLTGVLLEQTAPFESVCMPNQLSMPRIYDDAYLNLICLPNGSLSGVSLIGEIETVFK